MNNNSKNSSNNNSSSNNSNNNNNKNLFSIGYACTTAIKRSHGNRHFTMYNKLTETCELKF